MSSPAVNGFPGVIESVSATSVAFTRFCSPNADCAEAGVPPVRAQARRAKRRIRRVMVDSTTLCEPAANVDAFDEERRNLEITKSGKAKKKTGFFPDFVISRFLPLFLFLSCIQKVSALVLYSVCLHEAPRSLPSLYEKTFCHPRLRRHFAQCRHESPRGGRRGLDDGLQKGLRAGEGGKQIRDDRFQWRVMVHPLQAPAKGGLL